VLQDISDLYNQFIGSLSSSQVEDLETEEPQSESPDPAPEGPEGEELLASIDQLYCQMMEEGKLEHDAPDAHEEADGEQLAELSALLEELLWSALLLARGVAEPSAVEKQVLQLLPPSQLGQALHIAPLPQSLRNRLVELPQVAKLTPGNSAEELPWLIAALRRARDAFLRTAVKPAESQEDTSDSSSTRRPTERETSPVDTGSSARTKRKKPRRSSMSYWTPESLEAMEAPRR